MVAAASIAVLAAVHVAAVPTGPGMPAASQDAVIPSAAALEAHVRFLADDLLRGRDPGTEGYTIRSWRSREKLQGCLA